MGLVAVLLIAKAVQAGGLSWKPPPTWTPETRDSPMRVATYRVPAAAGDAGPAELGIFFFGQGAGGSSRCSELSPKGRAATYSSS
jgi:hypothetical protein